jgi:protein involved in polysaccharide export with SLBB domain
MTRSNSSTAIMVAMLMSTSFSMKAQVRRAQAQAAVSEFLRPLDITGEVNKSGTFPVIDAPTLVQLLQMAGGLTRNAGSTAILIHFSDNPPRMPLSRASLTALVRSGSVVPRNITLTRIAVTALDTRPRVESQDVLFIPAKNES